MGNPREPEHAGDSQPLPEPEAVERGPEPGPRADSGEEVRHDDQQPAAVDPLPLGPVDLAEVAYA
jgi:hypothetical protein